MIPYHAVGTTQSWCLRGIFRVGKEFQIVPKWIPGLDRRRQGKLEVCDLGQDDLGTGIRQTYCEMKPRTTTMVSTITAAIAMKHQNGVQLEAKRQCGLDHFGVRIGTHVSEQLHCRVYWHCRIEAKGHKR